MILAFTTMLQNLGNKLRIGEKDSNDTYSGYRDGYVFGNEDELDSQINRVPISIIYSENQNNNYPQSNAESLNQD